MATTPSPKAISVNVPRYSERNSPQTVLRQAAPAPMRTCQTPVIPRGSVAVSDTSTSLSRTSGFQKVRLRGGWIAVLARCTSAGDSARPPAARCSGVTNAPRRVVSSRTSVAARQLLLAAGTSARPDVDRVEPPKLAREAVLAADPEQLVWVRVLRAE